MYRCIYIYVYMHLSPCLSPSILYVYMYLLIYLYLYVYIYIYCIYDVGRSEARYGSGISSLRERFVQSLSTMTAMKAGPHSSKLQRKTRRPQSRHLRSPWEPCGGVGSPLGTQSLSMEFQ